MIQGKAFASNTAALREMNPDKCLMFNTPASSRCWLKLGHEGAHRWTKSHTPTYPPVLVGKNVQERVAR